MCGLLAGSLIIIYLCETGPISFYLFYLISVLIFFFFLRFFFRWDLIFFSQPSAKRKLFQEIVFSLSIFKGSQLTYTWHIDGGTQLNWIFADSDAHTPLLRTFRTTSTRHKRNMNIFLLFLAYHNDIIFGMDISIYGIWLFKYNK